MQWTTAGQQALQDGMTAAVARQYPLPGGIGNLGGTGGLRYMVTPTLLDLKRLNLLDGSGRFCGSGANYNAIKAELAQFRLSHNTVNPNAQANRVVGIVDPAVGLGPPDPCFEGMAVVNSQEAWALARPGRAGQLIGLELAHTLGLTPPNRESPFDGAHSQNVAAENPSLNRRYNVVQRSFIVTDRNLLKPSGTSPAPDNVNTLLEVPDFRFLLCVFGGTPNTECQASGPGTVNASAPVAASLSFVMSGTTTGAAGISPTATATGAAAGTSVVESYFASSVPQTAPLASSTYRLVQRATGGSVLSNQGVPVSFLNSGHKDGAVTQTGAAGLFSIALPFLTNTDRIELWKGAPGASGSLLLYARNRTNPPVVTSFSVGGGIDLRAGPRGRPLALAAFVVDTPADSGTGSLRQAILDANSTPGSDTITFSDSMTIAPTSSLPIITEAVTIDGTQGSSTTPTVTLDGTAAGVGAAGLRINASGVTIKRLAIVRFGPGVNFLGGAGSALESSYVGLGTDGVTDLGNANDGVIVGGSASGTQIGPGNVISGNGQEGVHLQGSGGTIVQGNFIGTNAAGTAAVANGQRGILMNGGSGNTIGGTSAAARNVISGNLNVGIIVGGASNNTIQGNRIGTNAAGTAAVPNGPGGIQLLGGTSAPFGASGNTIGGIAAGAGNLISGNTGPGILMNSNAVSPGVTGNTIRGNLIGTSVTGTTSALGNTGHGISIVNVGGISGNVIGAGGAGSENVIAYNGGDGISIQSDTGNLNNPIRENQIHTNVGLAIDLGPDGVTANDAGDGDTGANNLQNFPVLTAAGGGSVQGTLSSASNTQYVIELFSNAACDGSGNGEAARFLESFAVTTNGAGSASFTRSPPTLATGEYVTATATDASVAPGSTSELSACLLVSGGGGGGTPQTGPTFTVNTNSDGTPADAGCTTTECTLREAIVAANAQGGANAIVFDLPVSTQIALTSALPFVTGPVDIDGTNLLEGSVSLNGLATSESSGLVLASGSGGSTLEDLEIHDFDGAAIDIASAGNSVVGNSLWAIGNGIVIQESGASENQIGGSDDGGDGNQIWDFSSYGVKLDNAGSGNVIAGNTIGLDEANTASGGEIGLGVIDTSGTVIGYEVTPDQLGLVGSDLSNVIVASSGDGTGYGISLSGENTSGTIVAGNFVGLDRAEEFTSLGNNGIGVAVEDGAADNQLGPGNRVAYNGGAGIEVSGGDGNRIVANFIHDNGGLGISLSEGNNDLNAPSLDSASLSGTTTTVAGSISGVPNGDYFVEVFRNSECDSSESGEGETYLDFASVTVTDGSGSFSKTLSGLALGDVVTATLTGVATDNTSEFSNCVTVEASSSGSQEQFDATSTDDNPADNTLDLYLDCGAGKPIQVIAVGLLPDDVTATTASWSGNYDSTLAPANCALKAVVMDGVNRTGFTATGTETVNNGPNALVAAVSSPREGATFLQYGLIPLRGSVRNADGELDGSALQWTLTGPGISMSGTGPIVDQQPPASGGWPNGTYTATLTTPGAGPGGTDTVTFNVLTDADNDGMSASVESQPCFGADADNDPLNAYDDSDNDGLVNASDPQPCVPATSYTAIVDFNPDPLPTGSSGNTVTVEVRVPGRNIAQVLPSSVRITRIADQDVSSTDPRFANIGWTVKSGVGIAKFDRLKLVQYLASRNIRNRVISITVAGGKSSAPAWSFEGSDTTFVQG